MTTASHRLLAGLCAAVLLSAANASAADAPDPAARWGLKALYGFGGAGGDYGNGLEKYMASDFELYRKSPRGGWRYGVGLGFGSFAMKPPYEDAEEFGLLRTYAFGTRVFRANQGIRPYLEVQAGLARMHPRSLLFAIRPLPEDIQIGDSPTRPANGFGVALVPGLEISLTRSLSLDASLQFDAFHTDEYDLSPIGQPPASAGSTFGGRLGLNWVPNGGGGGGTPDAWGVRKSYGWATAETLAINIVASRRNEYKRNANFNQISPRSWAHNISSGFDYDDNEFRTNQLQHPFNGSTYFNSARTNGHAFWVSSAYALAGAFFWECCGETHPMSYNDMISTGIGGIALGEMMYRLSSTVLDNSAHGMSRFWKEAGAFLVDPIRGFNRLVSGRASRVDDNPSDPMDWRPPGGGTFLALGARIIGRGESISSNTKTTGYFEVTTAYGSPFEDERNKPFDTFETTLQFNFGDKVPLGQAQVVGALYKKGLGQGDDGHPNHVLEIAQHYDYMNNTDYEFGGQSFGPSLLSRFDLGSRWSLRTRVDATAMVLGAINSEYAKIAQVGDRERLREYDYGPGLGAAAKATLSHGGRPLLQAGYRFQWINVSNGSVYNNDQLGLSSSAEHYIQLAGLRLMLPIRGSFGIGGDATVFFRKSRYSLPVFQDIDQRNPQARVYLTVNGVR